MTPDSHVFKAAFYADDPASVVRTMTPAQRQTYSRLLDRKAAKVEEAHGARIEALADRLEAVQESRGQLLAASMDDVPTGVTAIGCALELRGIAHLARLRTAGLEAQAQALLRLAA